MLKVFDVTNNSPRQLTEMSVGKIIFGAEMKGREEIKGETNNVMAHPEESYLIGGRSHLGSC